MKNYKNFRKSAIKNGILQEIIKTDLGYELLLTLGVKTRWNSMQNMIESLALKPIKLTV